MVYFGEKRFNSAQPGVTSREKSRIMVPTILFLVLVMVLIAQQWDSPDENTPVRTTDSAVTPSIESPEGSVPALEPGAPHSGTRVQNPVEVSSFQPNSEPAPFVEDWDVLAGARDSVANPGAPEEAGLAYLFHRFRNGPEIAPVPLDVEWEELPEHAERLRGVRMERIFRLVEDPIPRLLEPNPSGVRRYWEAFARDENGHFARLQFVEKPKILSADTEVRAIVDFYRLHMYQTLGGDAGRVPEYVALSVEPVPPLDLPESNWSPLLWAGGVSLAALAFLIVGSVLRDGPQQSRRRARRPGLVAMKKKADSKPSDPSSVEDSSSESKSPPE